MADIIQILPDAIANQIAAGEVVQRPSSVVKELMENALDAEATKIDVLIEQAGKNLIQVIDNGKGMSETDARMAFERHATSKIRKADDLFALRTMGFRGEALASISAVSKVELKTKQEGAELGTHLTFDGSELVCHERVACTKGSNFSIKSLFFNIPARRKFLKTDATELRHIITEFQRQALANTEVAYSLTHNGTELFRLPVSNPKGRIVHILGSSYNAKLIRISSDTEYVKVSGYVGKPEAAKKKFGEQFFFVNNRYMRHSFLNKAIQEAFKGLIPVEAIPSYFISLQVDPSTIDVNIHPTKTEIKFEDERTLYQVLVATVKEALGKFNLVPSIDFEEDHSVQIPAATSPSAIAPPTIKTNPDYNPFDNEIPYASPSTGNTFQQFEKRERQTVDGWQNLYDFDFQKEDTTLQTNLNLPESHEDQLFQLKDKYILSQVKSGLMVIHQRRAHQRILYDRFLLNFKNRNAVSQKLLFPQTVELSTTDFSFAKPLLKELNQLGFEIEVFGKNSLIINALPADLEIEHTDSFFQELFDSFRDKEQLKEAMNETLANSLSKVWTINHKYKMNKEEMQHLLDSLFSCPTPNYTPDGKKIVHIIQLEDIDKRFQRLS